MKNKLKLFMVLLLSSMEAMAQPGQVPTNNAPGGVGPSGQNSQQFWSRAGNNNNMGQNNIFGTLWNSPIYTYTAGLPRAMWTTGATLTSIVGNTGDGLRIFDPAGINAAGHLDLFTAGATETHIKWGVSGQVSGQNARFEQYAHLSGFRFSTTQNGIYLFSRGGMNGVATETARIGTNNFWLIGPRFTGNEVYGLNANRRLEVCDATTQFRLSYALNDNHTFSFTDFKSRSTRSAGFVILRTLFNIK